VSELERAKSAVSGRLRGVSWLRMRQRIADERRSRRLAKLTTRDLTPPAPWRFRGFGEGSVIVPPARVDRPDLIEIGAGVVIHEHAWMSVVAAVEGYTPRLAIGDGTSIGRFCHIACVGEVEIGSRVLTAERIFIGDTFHGYEDVGRPIIQQPMAVPQKVTVDDGAFIGIGAVILPGVTIGKHAYVGAGAVVASDVPPHTVVIGNPARVVKSYDEPTRRWVARPRVATND
jgi:acetyltransferase-like isoleucine patch superfamily enzyme